MKAVIAIGGNALVAPGGSGNIAEQFARSRIVAGPLADLVEQGWQVTVTHGNGPQVGSILMRVEISSKEVYPIDMGLAVANTQAGMGYMIAQTWGNELRHRGTDRSCVVVVTTVLVDRNDPAFANPSKPIGPFLDEPTARRHEAEDGWRIIEDAGRGYRRVVPSPKPLSISQIATIKTLVDMGELVIAGGGGGIPVIENDAGDLQGVEAVIDKDYTSAIIAAEVDADVLVLVTGVEHLYANFRKPDQETLHTVSLRRVEELIAQGQFAAGSMLPKVESAVQFLKARNDPKARAIITELHHVPDALAGRTGTTITL
jgi:carbamate kinase